MLYVASRASHIRNFHLPYLKYYHDEGWTIHVLAEGAKNIAWSDRCIDIPFEKKLTSWKNWRTIGQIYRLLQAEKYQVISVHTTLAAFLTRIAVRFYGTNNVKTINTSHGYLFSEKTPPIKRTFYVAAEKLCRPATQLLLVMNEEDYRLAQRYNLSAGTIALIPGMGLPEQAKPAASAQTIREKFHFQENDVVAVYGAEFSKRKNQQFLINALPAVIQKYPQFKLILAGTGEEWEHCRRLIVQKQLTQNILLPGHVDDMISLFGMAQLAISSSKSEGLPFNIMEALQAGLPVLASRVKGHVDLIEEGKNGYLFDLDNETEFCAKVSLFLQKKTSLHLSPRLPEKYWLEHALPFITQIHQELLM